jgi:hypothetical protein
LYCYNAAAAAAAVVDGADQLNPQPLPRRHEMCYDGKLVMHAYPSSGHVDHKIKLI